MSRGVKAGAQITIKEINTSSISDGVYDGKYSSGRFSNELQVTVKDQKITDVKIVKDVMFSKPEVSKELFDKVIKAQNTTVDIVSGATVTSKAYLKSIENALNK